MDVDPKHLSLSELEAGLDAIRNAPRDEGPLEMIVRRPAVGRREVLERADLDTGHGLDGDNWETRGSRMTPDGRAHPGMQLNIMGARAIALIAGDRSRWALAGDQLFIDLDLSGENLPAGTQLAIGTAVLEVTDVPHTGCRKFVERFGPDAQRFVNSPEGRRLNLRGINARVARSGTIRRGDVARKILPRHQQRPADPRERRSGS